MAVKERAVGTLKVRIRYGLHSPVALDDTNNTSASNMR